MKNIRKFLCTLLTSALLLGIASFGVPVLQVNAVEFDGITIPAFSGGYAMHDTEAHDAGPTPDGGCNYQLTYNFVTANQVDAYKQQLLEAGFVLYDQKEIKNGSKTNLFATYVNDDVMVHINYFPTLTFGRFHIIYGSAEYLLPKTEADDYEAVITPSVAIINATDTVLCMVVQLADGSYVVIDGGYSTYFSNNGVPRDVPEASNSITGKSEGTVTRDYNADHDTLLAYLRDTNRDGDINEKDTTPQVIWMATHADADHIGLPITFLSDNLDSDNYHQYINLTAVIYNFPEFTNIGLSEGNASELNLRVSRFIEAATTSFPDAKHYIYHTGQVLNLPGCQIEFLYTPEDYYPNDMTNANYTCGMWRFLFDGGKSLLITGDSETETTKQAYNVLGSYLKSDMLQVIHHGANGGTEDFYNAVDPEICFWPCMDLLFKYDKRMLGDSYAFNKILRDGNRTHYTSTGTSTVYIPMLSYNANGGTGTMDSVAGFYCAEPAKEGTSPTFQSTLPANKFTGPDNQNFLGWTTSPGGDVVYAPGDIVNVSSSMELYAVWKEKVTFERVGHNVRLQDLIKIGYYFKVAANVEIAEVGTLLWTEEDYNRETDFTVTSKLAKEATITVSKGVYTAETDGIYAQYLDTVYYAIPYVKTENGNYFYGEVDDYSVLEYAQGAYEDPNEEADLKELIVDLLNYATATRTYFDCVKNNPPLSTPFNSFLSAEDQTLAWDENLMCTDPIVSENVGIGGSYELEEIPDVSTEMLDAQYIGRNINLLDAISIGVYYDNTDVRGAYYWTESAYNATGIHNVHTKSGDALLTRYDTYVKLSIPKIYSFNIYDNYYIRAYNSEGRLSAIKGFSVAGYLSQTVREDSSKTDAESQALTNLAKAMLIYGNHAKTYFANQQ